MFFKQKPQKDVLNSTLIFKITFDFFFSFLFAYFSRLHFLRKQKQRKTRSQEKKNHRKFDKYHYGFQNNPKKWCYKIFSNI